MIECLDVRARIVRRPRGLRCALDRPGAMRSNSRSEMLNWPSEAPELRGRSPVYYAGEGSENGGRGRGVGAWGSRYRLERDLLGAVPWVSDLELCADRAGANSEVSQQTNKALGGQ